MLGCALGGMVVLVVLAFLVHPMLADRELALPCQGVGSANLELVGIVQFGLPFHAPKELLVSITMIRPIPKRDSLSGSRSASITTSMVFRPGG